MIYDDWLQGIKENKFRFWEVPEEHKTPELCLETVKRGTHLYSIPLIHRTYELCLEAVKHKNSLDYICLFYVPEEHRTYEMCFEAAKNGDTLFYVLEEHRKEIQNLTDRLEKRSEETIIRLKQLTSVIFK